MEIFLTNLGKPKVWDWEFRIWTAKFRNRMDLFLRILRTSSGSGSLIPDLTGEIQILNGQIPDNSDNLPEKFKFNLPRFGDVSRLLSSRNPVPEISFAKHSKVSRLD